MMPASYPDAMPSDDMRETARESAALTLSSPLKEDDVPNRATVVDDASSSDGRACRDEDIPSRLIRACMTSGDAFASAGRYTFIAMTDAPKLTLEQVENSGDGDDSGRRGMGDKEPIAENFVSRSGFCHVAGGRRGELV